MAFAIVARFPLGGYRGHVRPGVLEEYPSVARLHAALLCAAGSGLSAEAVSEGHLEPASDDLATLEWLEQNHPTGVVAGPVDCSNPTAIAYRNMGQLHSSKAKGWRMKAAAKAPTGMVPMELHGWTWDPPPPEDVQSRLEALCADVSHLGTSESPVRLSVETASPTHVLDAEADLFAPGGVDVDLPLPGRAAALCADYASRWSLPIRSDATTSNEVDISQHGTTTATALARYAAIDASPVETLPWSRVILLPLDQPITDGARVLWAHALHQALISMIGFGAPPVLTGSYAPGDLRPANRVAIQIIPNDVAFPHSTGAPATAALLIPTGTPAPDLQAVQASAMRLTELRGPRGKLRCVRDGKTLIGADRFWDPPAHGFARQWTTIPAAVPETRSPRGARWSLADAALLSVGLVWRDKLTPPGRGDSWYRNLRDAAAEVGVTVHNITRIADGDLSRFVHKVPRDLIVQPYKARLSLGELGADRALTAIGQSRHLGGGLLIPTDVPASGSLG
ncbi:MAG: type I-U CRISPR-associated protein Csb2 [Candidatus Nanopelagicales bacterium]|nr:type I-U CRISPR-associated protein Csb2 [Candidatus Nanopelagicales bacterium]